MRSPLDEIIDKLGGPDRVAEMTGRRCRVVRLSPSDAPVLQLRDSLVDVGSGSSSSSGLDTLNVREVSYAVFARCGFRQLFAYSVCWSGCVKGA